MHQSNEAKVPVVKQPMREEAAVATIRSFRILSNTGGVARINRIEFAGFVGLDKGAIGGGEGGIGAEGDAIGDGASAARNGDDAGAYI